MKGIVKWFSREKGFGFICSSDTNKDIFVHASDVDADDHILIDGQHVEFEVEKGPKGPKAKKVIIVPED